MRTFVANAADLLPHSRWDVGFTAMLKQYGDQAKELSHRFSPDEVKELLAPIALQDLAVLLPLGRNGRDRLTRPMVDIMIRDYPHLALAAVIDDIDSCKRRNHEAVATAFRYRDVLENLTRVVAAPSAVPAA